MRLFYYTWFENSAGDLEESLLQLGYSVVKCHIPMKNYENDPEFCRHFIRLFREYSCEAVISFDFFPLIAGIAEELRVRYFSWVYDMPHHTINSPAAQSSFTSLFLFDREQYMQMKQVKPEHTFYLPLAVNTDRLNRQRNERKSDNDSQEYSAEISFVGSLYDKNLYRQITYLPEYLKGYLQGVMEAQQKIYGYHMVEELLDQNVYGELQKYVIMNLEPGYAADKKQLYVDMIDAEITCQERIRLLGMLAERYQVHLYTSSDASLVPCANHRGIVSYDTEMPEIFWTSKINLNITLRSIRQGIPLRALDIMGAGGFLMSNYQAGLAEEFEDGRDMVMFESREDLLKKVEYYLEHDAERREIALRGREKVEKKFSYEVQLKKMFAFYQTSSS